ncbi:MAG TPA: DUF3828 domain-containing protein [Pyrinomonadaceae bacterium]|jgi:opacity protein-like surface antigen
MKSLILALAILSLAAAPAAAQTVRKPAEPPLVINDPAPATPASVVRELYKAHRNGRGHVFEKQGRRLQQKFFDAKLAALLWKNLSETPEGELGRIDFDPLYNAQDTQIKNFRVGAGTVKGDAAGVAVTFVNFDQQVKIDFRLVREKGVWKISNIVYGGGSDLLKILSEPT